MLWTIGFLVTFLFGGLTGIILSSPALDFPLSDSYFVVAHFHYVVFGTVVFAMFAGLLLLVAQDDRPDARRAAGQGPLLDAVHRLPHHVPHPALAGRQGHAASVRGLLARRRLHVDEPGLDDRRRHPRRLDAAVPLERLHHVAQRARWSPSTTRGATAPRSSGPPAARRRGTTSRRCRASAPSAPRSTCTTPRSPRWTTSNPNPGPLDWEADRRGETCRRRRPRRERHG